MGGQDSWVNFGAMAPQQAGGQITDCRIWDAPRVIEPAEFGATANALARGLLAKGLQPGERVALISANRWEYLAAYCGILRAGLQAVPVSDKFPAATVDFILEDAAVRHVFHDATAKETLLAAPAAASLGKTNFDQPADFAAIQNPGPFSSVAPESEDVAMVLYTSGSTGRPKGVPLSHAGHIWAMHKRIEGGRDLQSHCLLVAAPLYHMNALCSALFTLAVGAGLVLLPRFDARHYLQAIARFRCTWITSVPTMLAMALQEKTLLKELDLSSVRVVRMGSAPISPKLWADVEAAFPGAGIMNGYGTTEAGPVVFAARPGKKVPPLSVGFAHPDVDIKLIDGDGRESDQGVLWHRTGATMRGYLNLPEKTREVLTEDGWYISGDVFRRDEAGAYFFVGRADDMFVCGGENIYPGEVEAVLETHPDIEQSCVVPVPDEIKGEKPVAFVVTRAESAVAEETVKRYALAEAPAYQHPRRVFFMSALPLAGPGKIDRKGLQQEAVRRWSETSA